MAVSGVKNPAGSAPPQGTDAPSTPAAAPPPPSPTPAQAQPPAPKSWLPNLPGSGSGPKKSDLFSSVKNELRAATNKLTGEVSAQTNKLTGELKAETNTLTQEAKNAALGVEKWGEAKLQTAELLTHGLPELVGSELARQLDFKAGPEAFGKISKLSDKQLASLPDDALATMAKTMLNPNLVDRAVGAPNGTARSEQAFRLLTAHGTDAGHLDGIIGRLGYLNDPASNMTGPPQAKLQTLLTAARATPGDWKGFEGYMDAATGTSQTPGTKVTPLINGQVAFPKMYEAIDGAKSSVNVTVFSFQSDKTGWAMAKHLADAADRGCQVRVIYDPKGSDTSAGGPTDPAVYKFMKDHGVQVIAQTPGPLADHLTHRKITVVDGKTGFIGGMNIGDEYSTQWHDAHAMVTGNGVADMQKLFVSQWKADGGSVTPQQEQALFPQLQADGDASARIVGHSGGSDQNMKLGYLRAIDTAQKTINVANPYFSDPDVVSHLEAAAKRGVHVTVILPQTNDETMEQDAERAMYGGMIKAGIHLYEYHGRPMAHDKVASFDGSVSTIGSSNLDARSLGNNDEGNVWTGDPGVAQQLDQQLFGHDITQSRKVTAGNLSQILGNRRLQQGFASKIANQL